MALTFVGDFETTVYKGQTRTEVWASALVELNTEDVHIFQSIDETYDYILRLNESVKIYYHNLKFDGAFWLSYLLDVLHYEQALITTEDGGIIDFKDYKDMSSKSVAYTISDMGQWYSITIKIGKRKIEILDSLKLLPFSVKRIGIAFKTKHQKLDMEYEGYRYAGCIITDEERKYIANDVMVIKEALEIMFDEGHNKLTIGSCCLSEFKSGYDKEEYRGRFPNLKTFKIDPQIYGANDADEYIRKSYRGGWCYVVKGKENKILSNGTTADVNSLYPSMMSSQSGNRYPYGYPEFWQGEIPEYVKQHPVYYFVRLRTQFYIKENKLPFIQMKNTLMYLGTESLETSDIYDPKTKQYYAYREAKDGTIEPITVTLTMTCTDYELMQEHYDLKNTTILDGCFFKTEIGLFDNYMEKYKRIKMTSKGAKRELAKLFLNNLYGKMASSDNSSFKVVQFKPDHSMYFVSIEKHDKAIGYIPIGSAITSYARCFTIRAAQQNFYGKNKCGFVYADTDSIHCDLPPSKIKGITVHPSDFCCWKLESCWDVGYFSRQKTYIEHVTHEDEEPIENPYYNVKCAGMPETCKDLFIKSMTGYVPKPEDNYDEDKLEFLKTKRTISDFTLGLKIPGKLVPKRIEGGVLLVETTYEMR